MKDYINYSITEYEGIKVVELVGSLASNTIKQLESLILPVIENESVMINMSNIRSVTTAGINTIMDLSFVAKEKGRRIVILWPNDDLLNMTEMLDVHEFLIYAESMEEGRTKIKFYT
ncbi:STAS domain-containing protein [Spirochaetota bacterium]